MLVFSTLIHMVRTTKKWIAKREGREKNMITCCVEMRREKKNESSILTFQEKKVFHPFKIHRCQRRHQHEKRQGVGKQGCFVEVGQRGLQGRQRATQSCW